MTKLCVLLEVLSIEKVALAFTVTLFATLTERAVLPLKRSCAALPAPMARLLTVMLASIITVCPLEMVTLFVLVGTPVGVQMAGLLQLPPALETLFCEYKAKLQKNTSKVLNKCLINSITQNTQKRQYFIPEITEKVA